LWLLLWNSTTGLCTAIAVIV